MKTDLHNHTVFSDGKNTVEEMIEAAIATHLDCFGISDHSYTSFDPGYCMAIERYDEYKALLNTLKGKYNDRIQLLCGIEYDYYSDFLPEGFDYVIGSLHYVKCDDRYLPIDMSRQEFRQIAADHFNNDFYALCEAYYDTLSHITDKCQIDIVGHFDLVTKYNEGGAFFDENDPRYVRAWQKAMLKLLEKVKCFEINYGAVNKGLRSTPYLSAPMQKYLLEHGGTVILSSDSHSTATVGKF